MTASRPPRLPEGILEGVRQRDADSLNAFFEFYFDRAYNYVRRLVRNEHEAEDITQVAFLKIHRAVETLDPDRDPTSWVFAVVSNAVRDYWRSRSYRQAQRDKPLEDVPARSLPAGENDLEIRDTMAILEQAVAGLTETLREVVLLRDVEGLGYAEIATALGIEEPTARKRHSRALQELRRALEAAERPIKETR